MNIWCISFFLLLSVLLPFTNAVTKQYYSPYYIGNWKVQTHNTTYICDTTLCCCFSDDVNIYLSATNELYFNGSVHGNQCASSVIQDNIDPPTSLSFVFEFFGIDNYIFNLANSTTNTTGLTITAVDDATGSCSFVLAQNTSLQVTQPSIGPSFVVPGFASSYLGSWVFDDVTCAVSNSSCCCYTGNVTIKVDPNGAQSFFITGPVSSGCRTSASQEEDDFPWPTNGTFSSSSVMVNGFLVNQDNYMVTLSQSNNKFVLSFNDLTTPMCSMSASRPANIYFGRASSLSGIYQIEDYQTDIAYNYWVNWTNSVLGGIKLGDKQYPVKLIEYDAASDPTKIPSIYQKLTLINSVTALFSPFSSTLTSVAENYTNGLPFIFTGSTTPSLYGKYPNAFGMSPPSSKRSVLCAQMMASAGVHSMSVLYTLGDVFNTIAASEAISECVNNNIMLLSNDTFTSGATDFSSFVTKWKGLNPDLLVISGTSPDPWNIIKAVRASGWWPKQIYFPTASTLENTIQEAVSAGQEWMVEYLMSADTWRPDQPGTDPNFGSPAGFAQQYQIATGQDAVSTYVSAFAAGYILTTAIQNAGSIDSESILAQLKNQNLTFWYGNVQFDSNGAPLMEYTCTQVFNASIRTISGNNYVYPAPHNAPPVAPTSPPTSGSNVLIAMNFFWLGLLILNSLFNL